MAEHEKGSFEVGVVVGGSPRQQFSGRLIFGLVMVTLGTLWTLDNLGLVDAESVLRWWPALILLTGLAKLFGIFVRRTPVSGGILSLLGAWMLLREFRVIEFSLFGLWPLALVAVGASIVWRSLQGSATSGVGSEDQPRFSVLALMSGNTRRVRSQSFSSAEASAVMGGVVVDLRQARAASERVEVDVFAWWGGIDILVPEDWRVVSEVTPVMGAVEDSTRPPIGEPRTTLVVRGVVIMGGVEIKSGPNASRDNEDDE